MYKDSNSNMSRFPEDTPLAMSYVPWQKYDEVYGENTALEKGTIFPDLYFPFKGRRIDANDSK